MFQYNIDLYELDIIDTEHGQLDAYFQFGHVKCLIPDFFPEPAELCDSFQDYIEQKYGSIYDQDGGEVISHRIINSDGLTRVEYRCYAITHDELDEPKDHNIVIEGYIVNDGDSTYLLAKSVTGDI